MFGDRTTAPPSDSADGGPSADAARLFPSTLRALGHRNYRLFFFGQLISLVGTWMQAVAQSWLVYRLTGSAVMLGLVGFAGQIPVFLLAPVGGTFADKYDRRRILVVTQIASMSLAFVLAALTLIGRVHEWHVFGLAMALGIVNAIDMPTRQAFVADMVDRKDLSNAIALNSAMVNGARIVGPAVAGVLVAAVGEGWCFLVNGMSYVAVIIGLRLIKIDIGARVASAGSAVSRVVEGFRYVARTGPIRALLLLIGLVSLTGMPYAVLMPIFADRILHGGARGLGLLMGAAGVGAFFGALRLAAKRELRGLGRWVVLSGVGFGASLILFSVSRSFWLSAVLLIPVGFSMMVGLASSNTLIQAMVPDELRGRVMAVYAMMFMGMAPFGSLFAGAIAHRVGAPVTVALGGSACITGAVVFGAKWPALRSQARQLIATGRTTPPENRGETSPS
jgi:MFS family permease